MLLVLCFERFRLCYDAVQQDRTTQVGHCPSSVTLPMLLLCAESDLLTLHHEKRVLHYLKH